MQFLSFILIYPIIWLISRLPMRILYLLSNFIFFLMFRVFKYRRAVVENNISMAFPEKEKGEVTEISKKFFNHLTDLIVESVKSFSISKKESLKRYTYKNPELVNDLIAQGKSIILTGAHQANWEWSFNLPFALNTNVYGAYTRISNKYFDKKIYSSRTKFGAIGLKGSKMIQGMADNHKNNIQGLYILLSDQSPQLQKTYYWKKFMGIKVPIHTGAEMLAKRHNLTVVNYVTRRKKRGYYEAEFTLITDTPKEFKDYEITDKFLALTEQNIKEHPEFYLWSHKRFKHKDKYEEWLKKKQKK